MVRIVLSQNHPAGAKFEAKSPSYMEYVIPGEPIAWKRSGLNRSRFYDQQKKDKMDYAFILQSQHLEKQLFSGAIEMHITFYMPIAKGVSKSARNHLEGAYHRFKPDLDNVIKFLLDACTGVLFANDCIIVSIVGKKIYSSNPRTEFTLAVVE